MKYLLCLGLLLLCATHQAYPLFDHDRAVVAAHQGDWQQALHLMQQEVTHHPDDAQVLYDAGVAAYKQGHYQQAQAYFNNAAALSSQAYQPLLEQEALFNAGNSYVKLNQLEDAIKSYETLLARDQHHDKARHNLEVVKKMLEQQKQQQKKEEQEKRTKKIKIKMSRMMNQKMINKKIRMINSSNRIQKIINKNLVIINKTKKSLSLKVRQTKINRTSNSKELHRSILTHGLQRYLMIKSVMMPTLISN